MRIPFALFCAFLVACGDPAKQAETPPTPPRSIVSFKPNLTEIVFALGAGDQLIGVTDWCRYPEEAKSKEKLGGLGSIDLERLAKMRPDLCLASTAMPDLCAKVERLGIRTLAVRDLEIEDIDAAIESIGKALHREEAANTLRASMKSQLASLQEKLRGKAPAKTLLVLERQPGTVLDITVVGPRNVIDSLMRLGGGENIFSDAPLPYPKANKEDILARNPEYLLDFSVHGYTEGGDDAKEREAWKALPTLRAVREGKIVIMPPGFDLSPGPRIPQIAQAFARILHPELFR